MKFWVDMCTPKDVIFFRKIIEELNYRNHEIFITTRNYTETNNLINYFGLNAVIVGSHGKTIKEKIDCSVERMVELNKLFKLEQPDALISYTNPESCRIAFGHAIPIFNYTDIPEAEKVMRLTLPLSSCIYSPFCVNPQLIRNYWVGELYLYDCLDPVAWLPAKPTPLKEIFDEYITYPFIIYRESENHASYLIDKEDITEYIIDELKDLYPSGTFFKIPRYEEHKSIDLQSLFAYADLFIGGGGTMNIEATWWGTWTLACRKITTSYDNWLEDNYLQFRVHNVESAIDYSKYLLSLAKKNKNCTKLRNMVFPVKEICDHMEKLI